jgi:hypothetical protein
MPLTLANLSYGILAIDRYRTPKKLLMKIEEKESYGDNKKNGIGYQGSIRCQN